MLKVLIIDDVRASALVAAHYCDAEKWQSDIAHNLTDGLHLLSSKQYDCLVLDLMLPEVNDWRETIPKVRAVSDLPVVVLTSKEPGTNAAGIEIEIECIRQGAQEFVQKGSVDMLSLTRMIRRAVARKDS